MDQAVMAGGQGIHALPRPTAAVVQQNISPVKQGLQRYVGREHPLLPGPLAGLGLVPRRLGKDHLSPKPRQDRAAKVRQMIGQNHNPDAVQKRGHARAPSAINSAISASLSPRRAKTSALSAPRQGAGPT